MIHRLRHGPGELALHELTDGEGPTLLCLHELEGDAEQWRSAVEGWPGPVLALDFAGHGESAWLAGGGYTPELFAADADAALASLSAAGPVAVVGAGIGAYVALLLAGSRPDLVAAAGLLPGRGLTGGGAEPAQVSVGETGERDWLDLLDRSADTSLATDPLVAVCLTDLRPRDYAGFFSASARVVLLGEDGAARPPWWVETRRSDVASPGPADPAAMVAALASQR